MTDLSPRQFADEVTGGAVTGRQVRNLCEAGMAGARKVKSYWKIDPAKALAWLRDPENARVVSGRMPVELCEAFTLLPAPTIPGEPSNGSDAGGRESFDVFVSRLGPKLDDLDRILTLLTAALRNKREPRIATMVKQVAAEIRLSETHVAEMAAKEGLLIARERHRFVLRNVAARFRTGVESLRASLPDELIARLETAGVKVDRPDIAVRVFREVAEAEGDAMLTRVADDIEAADLETGDQQ